MPPRIIADMMRYSYTTGFWPFRKKHGPFWYYIFEHEDVWRDFETDVPVDDKLNAKLTTTAAKIRRKLY